MAIVRRLLETMGDHEDLSDLNDTDFIDEIRQRRDNPGDIVAQVIGNVVVETPNGLAVRCRF